MAGAQASRNEAGMKDRSISCFKEDALQHEELKMKMNEGTIERAGQIISGLASILMAACGTLGVWGWIQSACVTELARYNC
jgi:hypothetical protein